MTEQRIITRFLWERHPSQKGFYNKYMLELDSINKTLVVKKPEGLCLESNLEIENRIRVSNEDYQTFLKGGEWKANDKRARVKDPRYYVYL